VTVTTYYSNSKREKQTEIHTDNERGERKEDGETKAMKRVKEKEERVKRGKRRKLEIYTNPLWSSL